jgi:hypothetical protein
MRRTITLLATTLVVAAGITSTASAATLYTNSAHTTPVTVGTPLNAANPSGAYYFIYNAGGLFDACGSNSLGLTVTQNSGGVFKASLGYRFLDVCSRQWSASRTGSLQISGGSTTVGANKSWAATTLADSNGADSENFSGAGVSAQQPTTGGSPVSIVLDHAGTMIAGGQNLTVSGTYKIGGAYSLG